MKRNHLSPQERRGLIWLASIILAIIAIPLIRGCAITNDDTCSNSSVIEEFNKKQTEIEHSDSTTKSEIKEKRMSKKRKKKTKNSKSLRVIPIRNPLHDTIPTVRHN